MRLQESNALIRCLNIDVLQSTGSFLSSFLSPYILEGLYIVHCLGVKEGIECWAQCPFILEGLYIGHCLGFKEGIGCGVQCP